MKGVQSSREIFGHKNESTLLPSSLQFLGKQPPKPLKTPERLAHLRGKEKKKTTQHLLKEYLFFDRCLLLRFNKPEYF